MTPITATKDRSKVADVIIAKLSMVGNASLFTQIKMEESSINATKNQPARTESEPDGS